MAGFRFQGEIPRIFRASGPALGEVSPAVRAKAANGSDNALEPRARAAAARPSRPAPALRLRPPSLPGGPGALAASVAKAGGFTLRPVSSLGNGVWGHRAPLQCPSAVTLETPHPQLPSEGHPACRATMQTPGPLRENAGRRVRDWTGSPEWQLLLLIPFLQPFEVFS